MGLWVRVALLVVFIISLGFMAFRLVVKIVHPYREAGAQTQQLRGTRQEVAALNQENADLRQKIAYLKTPSGMTREARKMGYVHPGEIPFVVEGLMPSTLPSAAALPKKAVPTSGNRATRLWRRLTGH